MDIERRKKRKKGMMPQNDLGLQNMVRSKYSQNWPKVILHLTTRIQNINDQMAALVKKLLMNPAMKFEMYRDGDEFIMRFMKHSEVEYFRFSLEEVQDALPYIEILLLDRLRNSAMR